MHKRLVLFVAALLGIGLAGVSQAAPLKWSGTLRLEVSPPGLVVEGSFTGVSTINNSAGSGTLTEVTLPGGGTLAGSAVATMTTAVTRVVATLNGPAGTIVGGPQTAGFTGVVGFDFSGGGGLVTATAGVLGVGGTAMGSNGTTAITLSGTGWTTQFAHGPASLTTSTAMPSGVVKSATSTQVATNIPGFPSFSFTMSWKMHFVPEPGMLLLLGSGVIGLLLIGRSRIEP